MDPWIFLKDNPAIILLAIVICVLAVLLVWDLVCEYKKEGRP